MIRSFVIHQDTPIIFITSDGTAENVTAAMHHGAIDFLVKPVNQYTMRKKLAPHLKDFMIWRQIRSLTEQM
jgi:FixJ family two-component response regulator